jgi:hypothetical protein
MSDLVLIGVVLTVALVAFEAWVWNYYSRPLV